MFEPSLCKARHLAAPVTRVGICRSKRFSACLLSAKEFVIVAVTFLPSEIFEPTSLHDCYAWMLGFFDALLCSLVDATSYLCRPSYHGLLSSCIEQGKRYRVCAKVRRKDFEWTKPC
jgi:hypothetical protein